MPHTLIEFSIIIVNWNVCQLLDNCILSIRQQSTNKNYEIIVVDNASTDNSCQMIKGKHPDVSLIENKHNVGFAKACNQGFKCSNGRFILFLNPDTLFVNDVLSKQKRIFNTYSDIAIIGSKIITNENKLQTWARGHLMSPRTAFNHYFFLSRFYPRVRYFRGTIDNYDYQTITDMYWVTGASFAIRRHVFQQVEGFDESFFMYNEDIDLCYRVKIEGLRVVYAPNAIVQHCRGTSFKKLSANEIHHILIESNECFYKKHIPKKDWQTLKLITFIGTCTTLLPTFILNFFTKDKERLSIIKRNVHVAVDMLLNREMS